MKVCTNCRYYSGFRCMAKKYAPFVLAPYLDETWKCETWKLKKARVYVRRKRK